MLHGCKGPQLLIIVTILNGSLAVVVYDHGRHEIGRGSLGTSFYHVFKGPTVCKAVFWVSRIECSMKMKSAQCLIECSVENLAYHPLVLTV